MINQHKEYSVARGEGGDVETALVDLERTVQRMLASGWKLQGSVATGGSPSGAIVGRGWVWATQAMCR